MWPGYAAEIARQTSPVSSVRQSERACRSQVSATAGVVKCKALHSGRREVQGPSRAAKKFYSSVLRVRADCGGRLFTAKLAGPANCTVRPRRRPQQMMFGAR